MGLVSPRLLWFFPVSIIPPMLHTEHHRVALTRTYVRGLGAFQKIDDVSEIAECRNGSTFTKPRFPISCKSAVPKVCSADPKGSATTPRGNPWLHFWNGYLEFDVLLKILAKRLSLAICRWPRPASSFRSAQAATLLEFHVPLTNCFVRRWFCAVHGPKPPLHRHNWLSFGKFQDTERFLIHWARHFSSQVPPSGRTCKYAKAPSTKKNFERFSTYIISMLLSAVSVLVVAQSSSEVPEELMNNPVYIQRKEGRLNELATLA